MNLKYSVAESEDIEGIVKLCSEVFNEETSKLVSDLFYRSHKRENVVFFAAKYGEEVVGTLCIIDFPVKVEDVALKTAELGIVATDERYRNLGINSKLTELFFEKAAELGYEMIVIEGIPYFYRRYGFDYAVKMGGDSLSLDGKDFAESPDITVRKATPEDVGFIFENHRKTNEKVGVRSIMEKEVILSQCFDYESPETGRDAFIIEKSGEKAGYFILSKDPDGYTITDIPDMDFGLYEAVMAFLKGDSKISERKSALTARIPEPLKFIDYLKGYGAKRQRGYAWQIKIADDFEFLKKIKPLLEKRLENSNFAGESFEFRYNNFGELIKFSIDRGKIGFEREPFRPNWEFNVPREIAPKLFLGCNTLGELIDFYPDCYADEKIVGVLNTLFPRLSSYFYQNY